jgi:hypothetical protein
MKDIETTGVYKEIDGQIVEVQVSLEEAREYYIENHDAMYPKQFFARMRKLRTWQSEAGEKMANQFDVKSVVDFGCAQGYYLEGFQRAGAKVQGFEYSYDAAKQFIPDVVDDFVSMGDVSDLLECIDRDTSFSIEVAEHILPEKSEAFADNLAGATRQIILSAAQPGSKGTGHINNRPNKFWFDLLEERGFGYNKAKTSELREIFATLSRRSKYTRFLSRSVMFFDKGE